MTTAAVMTYDSLVENIQAYLERTDPQTLDKIPLFIMLALIMEKSGLSFSVYRALSPRGNPTLKTLLALLNATGLRLGMQTWSAAGSRHECTVRQAHRYQIGSPWIDRFQGSFLSE